MHKIKWSIYNLVQSQSWTHTRVSFIAASLQHIYINSLVETIEHLGLGVDVDGEKTGILLYADDLVLIFENEADLHAMLDILNNWCENNKINLNAEK